jgi:hypothetical protein
LYAYLLNKENSNFKNVVPIEVDVFLLRLEVECSLLGNGGVLVSFSNKGTGFNVMGCQSENGDIIVIWMLNLLIVRLLQDLEFLNGPTLQ